MQPAAPGPQSGPPAAAAPGPGSGADRLPVMQPAAPGPATSTWVADLLEAAGILGPSGSTELLTPQTVLGIKALIYMEREYQQSKCDMQHVQALRESAKARQPSVRSIADMHRINAMMESILARQEAVEGLHDRLHAAIVSLPQQGRAGAAPAAAHPGGMGGRGLGRPLRADELELVSEQEFAALVDILAMSGSNACEVGTAVARQP